MMLFEPGKIGRLSVRNRIYMLPMRPVLLDTDGSLSQRAIDFYVARAKGGVGTISTSLWMVERMLEAKMEGSRCVYPMADGFTYVDKISQLADSLHDYNTKMVTQLSAGFGRILPPWCYSWQAPRPPIAPSAQPWLFDPSVTTREISVDEIKTLVQAFAKAARIMASAGVDGIELQGVSGYLIDQFMTTAWNHRTDKYGGNLEGRLRFLMEIIDAIKSATGANLPIIFRYSVFHAMALGRDLEEGLEVARRLENAGVDALSIVIGCHEGKLGRQHTPFTPLGEWAKYAAEVKKVVNIPVIAAGRLGYPDLAEEVLETGKADFIGLGRALLADPEWPNKVLSHKEDEIITCIACGDGCQRRTNQNKYVSCTLNPATGMEKELAIIPAETKKKVLVVGGGPAGMEAARVARLRGHEVTLWEKSDKLGGNLIPASIPDFKQDIRMIVTLWSDQLKRTGVKVELNKEATPEAIKEAKPDILFLATGSSPNVPPIPGIELPLVMTAVDVLLGKKKVGKNVIIAGGGSIGAETALYLAQQGKKVTLIEMTDKIAVEVFDESRGQLLRLLSENKVEQLTESTLLEIVTDGVMIKTKSGEQKISGDTVVLAMGMKSNISLTDKMQRAGSEFVTIGDCVKPRRIIDAIWEGFRRARVA